ncbi:MAG: hypothetical protein ACRBCS_16025 [Cellvibrionaceae bacterium]
MAELFWFHQLSKEAQARVLDDAKKQNIFHVNTYKESLFYSDGKKYQHGTEHNKR